MGQVMADISVGVLSVGSSGNAAWGLQMEQPGDPGNCHKSGILLELDFITKICWEGCKS